MLFSDRHDWHAVVRGICFLIGLGIIINLVAIVGRAHGKDFSTDTRRLPLRLQIALAYVDAACGIRIVSTWRRGAVIAGTNRPSLHRFWKAADFKTDHPDCARGVLRDWNGCLSIDYRAAKHFHIDTSGSRKCRFVHGSSVHRHARARSSRIASHDRHRSL